MKKVFSFLFVALISTSVFAQTQWNSDKAHSQLNFTITHLGIADVGGLFKDFDATIVASEDDFSDAVFELSVDVASIDTEIDKRDEHLRSADFFEVEKYPSMTYKSTSISKNGDNQYKLTGDLTLRGITKSVTMDLLYRGTIDTEQAKASKAGFQLTGEIKRSDFNIGAGFPEAMLSDEVTIKADGEFVKQ
jgi:polyisoprenoid-binding protein YceI